MLLWDVDTQVDFLSPGGRLYVPGAERIIPNLARLTAWAGNHQVPIVASACAHQPGDPELQIYGEHCMAGTPGQQKVPETLLPKRFVVPNRPIELPDLSVFQQTIVEKQAFDFSTNPNSPQVVRQFGAALQIALYGVVTEICVASAARALLALGHNVTLVQDAVAPLDARKAELFLAEFVGQGGTLTTVDALLAAPPGLAA